MECPFKEERDNFARKNCHETLEALEKEQFLYKIQRLKQQLNDCVRRKFCKKKWRCKTIWKRCTI